MFDALIIRLWWVTNEEAVDEYERLHGIPDEDTDEDNPDGYEWDAEEEGYD